MNTLRVRQGLVERLWPSMEGHLRGAVARNNGWTMRDLKLALLSGELTAWVILEKRAIIGAAVSCVTIYPRKKTCFVIFAGGEKADLVHNVIAAIEDWAITNCLDDVQIWARKAGAKLLPDYRTEYVILQKALK